MKKTNFGKNSRGAEAPLAPLAPPSMYWVIEIFLVCHASIGDLAP